MYSAIVKFTSVFREIRAAGFYNLSIHFNKINAPNIFVSRKLFHNAAVTCSDYKYILCVFMN